VQRTVRGAEAGGEHGDAVFREVHHRGHRLGHFAEARVAAPAHSGRDHLGRLSGEYRARGIDAVDAHVPDGPAAQIGLQTRVARADLLAELGGEVTRIAELAGA